jgi:4-amino-4-deoxy-L-arabinose transferase-like glycosyltransferase
LDRIGSRHLTIATLTILVIGTLWRLGHVELRGEEPRRAVVAVEMIESGEYVVPHMSGHTYYNKPPLFNWAVAGTFTLFGGTDSWMVRLPSLVSFWLVGLLVFLASLRFLDHRSALWSALFYLTGGELLFYGTVMTGELDLFYSLIVYAQALAIFGFMRAGRWTLLFATSYALAAAGFLTKGLPSIAFQGLTIVATLVAFGHVRRIFDPRHLLGLLVFAGIVVSYFWSYSQHEPVRPFLISLFEEASQRTGLGSQLGELLAGSLNFPLVVIKLLLPWSLLVVWMFRRGAWSRLWANPWTKFCLVFCAVNMPLYWFSGELRNRYIYAFFPFVLVPIAHVFATDRASRPVLAKWTDRVMQVVLGVLVIGAIAMPFVDPFRQFSGVLVTGAAWAVVGANLLALHLRRPDLRIGVFALALVLARIAFDVAYLPAMNLSRVSAYPPHVGRMVDITGDEPVWLAGPPQRLVREASVGPLELGTIEYTIPPSVAYQIPWHYARLSGRTLKWEEHPRPGDWCLIDKAQLAPGTDIRLEFHDHWTKRDLALVEWPTSGP